MRLLKRILSFMTCVALVAGTISLLPLQSEATNRSGNPSELEILDSAVKD